MSHMVEIEIMATDAKFYQFTVIKYRYPQDLKRFVCAIQVWNVDILIITMLQNQHKSNHVLLSKGYSQNSSLFAVN